MCLKVECAVNDIACLLNLTKSVQWQHVSLPSIDSVASPVVIVDIQTAAPAAAAGHRSIADIYPTSFDIVSGNNAQLFDVVVDRTIQDNDDDSIRPPDTATAGGGKRGIADRLLSFRLSFVKLSLTVGHHLLFCCSKNKYKNGYRTETDSTVKYKSISGYLSEHFGFKISRIG